jgi:hypothetical protein
MALQSCILTQKTVSRKQYHEKMIAKVVQKQRYKCVAVLVCLLMVGNSLHGAVLCFGTDGHVEIEPTFHERCNDPAHSQHTGQEQPSYQVNHVKNEHCRPCLDISISNGLVKTTRTPKQLNPAFSAPATNIIAPADQLNLSIYSSASISFGAAPYFVPLGTVVLLI